MTLHSPSLAVAAFTLSLALTAAMTVLAWMLKRQPGLWQWALGLWLAALGCMVFALREHAPEALVVLSGNALVCLSGGLVWTGMQAFCGRGQPLRQASLVSGLFVAFQAVFLFIWPSFGLRSILFLVMAASWSLACAWTLLRHGPPEVARSSRLLAGCLVADALYNLTTLLFRALAPLPLDTAFQQLSPLHFLEGIAMGTLQVLGMVLMVSHRLLGALEKAARRDGLTDLLNRRALDEEGPRLLELCRRQQVPCALIMMDIDHFKRLNDELGHASGDQALRHCASLLDSELRQADLLARYGGEEFCALLPGIRSEQAREVAERIRRRIEETPLRLPTEERHLTLSLGLAVAAPADRIELTTLIIQADTALYQAKATGRNQVRSL
nr:GGDEF domain-containing protein [uncultured Holophaga sp.]